MDYSILDMYGGISTHALREEGDPQRSRFGRHNLRISTHALREEGDFLWLYKSSHKKYFYPRPPRGGRPSRPNGV